MKKFKLWEIMNLIIQNIRDEVTYIKLLIFMLILFIFVPYLMTVLAQTTADSHYVTVDQDIWSFLKYVGVIFMGLLVWIGKEMVGSFKSLTKTIDDLNLTVKLNNEAVKNIEGDVAEIKDNLTRHDSRINTLEKNQRN